MRNIVIAGYARSPFTLANRGALMRVRPDDMAAQVISALIERTRVRPQEIEDLISVAWSGRRISPSARQPRISSRC
jgi:acetyl-CoA acyltransferase